MFKTVDCFFVNFLPKWFQTELFQELTLFFHFAVSNRNSETWNRKCLLGFFSFFVFYLHQSISLYAKIVFKFANIYKPCCCFVILTQNPWTNLKPFFHIKLNVKLPQHKLGSRELYCPNRRDNYKGFTRNGEVRNIEVCVRPVPCAFRGRKLFELGYQILQK